MLSSIPARLSPSARTYFCTPYILLCSDIARFQYTTSTMHPPAVSVNVVPHNGGEILRLGGGMVVRILEDGSRTDNRIGAVHITMPPHTPGPEQHWHLVSSRLKPVIIPSAFGPRKEENLARYGVQITNWLLPIRTPSPRSAPHLGTDSPFASFPSTNNALDNDQSKPQTAHSDPTQTLLTKPPKPSFLKPVKSQSIPSENRRTGRISPSLRACGS